MTVDTESAGAEDQEEELSPEENEGQDTSGQEESPPPPQPSQRERELERRLTQQGRELAQSRQALTTITSKIGSLESTLTSLTNNLSTRDQQDAERREREREAYLQTLPADQRALKKVELLEAELKSLRQSRTDANARPAANTPSEDPEIAEMRRVAQNIVRRAQTRYGVTLTQADFDKFPESAWEDEHEFHDAVYAIAEKKSRANPRTEEGEEDVAGKNGKGREDSEDSDSRTRRIVRQEMGVGSPAAPRAAAPKGKKPTDDDVKAAVQTYNSSEGPRAGLKKLKEMRARMG